MKIRNRYTIQINTSLTIVAKSFFLPNLVNIRKEIRQQQVVGLFTRIALLFDDLLPVKNRRITLAVGGSVSIVCRLAIRRCHVGCYLRLLSVLLCGAYKMSKYNIKKRRCQKFRKFHQILENSTEISENQKNETDSFEHSPTLFLISADN